MGDVFTWSIWIWVEGMHMYIKTNCRLNEHSSELASANHSQSASVAIPLLFHGAKIRAKSTAVQNFRRKYFKKVLHKTLPLKTIFCVAN
jgi:hypothetical protein